MSAAVRPRPLLSGRRGACWWGQKVQPAAQLNVQSQAKCELRAQRVSGGAARVSAALRQRPLLLARRSAAWPGSKGQRER